MILLIAVMMLLSPFRLVLSQVAPLNLSELLTVGATTSDLSEFDLSEVTNMAGNLYGRYFLIDRFATQNLALDDNEMISTSKIHNHLMIFNNLAARLDLANCNFPRHIVELCNKPAMGVASFHAILPPETLRTRRCANTISHVRHADKLAERFREVLHSMPPYQNLDFQLIAPYTKQVSAQAKLDQSDDLTRHYQGFLVDLSRLSKATLTWLGPHPLLKDDWSHHRFDRSARLQRLETLYDEASRNTSFAIRLGKGVLRDNWDAIEPYRTAVCHDARDLISKQGKETGNSTTSSWPVIFQQLTFTFW